MLKISVCSFYLVVFLTPFAWSHEPTIIFPRFYLSDGPLLVGLAAWVIAHYVRPGRRLSIGLFPLTAFLSLLVATSFTSWVEAYDRLSAAEMALRTLLGLFLYVLIVDTRPDQRLTTMALAASAALHSVIAISQYFLQRSVGLSWLGEVTWYPSGSDDWMRGFGLTPHPNILGGMAGLSLVCLTGITILGERRVARWRYLLLIVPAAGVASTFSRSAALAIAIAYLVVGVAVFRHRLWIRRLLVVLVIVSASAATLVLVNPWRYETRIVAPALDLMSVSQAPDREMDNLNQRWIQHEVAFRLIQDHAAFGVGGGNFMKAWRALASPHPSVPVLPVHDVPMLIGAEQGLFALASWLALLAWIFYRSGRLWRSDQSVVMLTWTAVIVFIVTVSFFDFYFWEWQQGRLILFTSLGFAALSLERPLNRDQGEASPPGDDHGLICGSPRAEHWSDRSESS